MSHCLNPFGNVTLRGIMLDHNDFLGGELYEIVWIEGNGPMVKVPQEYYIYIFMNIVIVVVVRMNYIPQNQAGWVLLQSKNWIGFARSFACK